MYHLLISVIYIDDDNRQNIIPIEHLWMAIISIEVSGY